MRVPAVGVAFVYSEAGRFIAQPAPQTGEVKGLGRTAVSIRRIATLLGRSVAASVGATALLAGRCLAQDASPSPAASSGQTLSSTAVFSEGTSLVAFALIFLFGLVVVFLVVLLVLDSERRYFTAVERLARLGGTTSPEAISATSESATRSIGMLADTADVTAAQELTASGSSTLTLGKAADYSATPGALADGATWTVDPVDAAAVNPSKGAKVKVVPAKVGAFKLTATSGSKTASLGIVVEAPATNASVLPFIGGAWGSMIVSVVVVDVVAVLGIAGVLGREGIATLFGALVGYLFGVRSSTGGGGTASSGTASSSGTTAGKGGAAT